MTDKPLPPSQPPPLNVLGPWTNLIIYGLVQIANAVIQFGGFAPDTTTAKVCSGVIFVLGSILAFLGHNSPSTVKAVRSGKVGLNMKGP